MLPAWSGCLWVRITCATDDQVRPSPSRLDSMAPSLPATPVSTMAASPPRTSTYADTNPRLTRSQASAPAPLPALDDAAGAAEAGPLGGGVGGGVAAELDAGLDAPALGAHAATDTMASANPPRPRSARKVRRVIGTGDGIRPMVRPSSRAGSARPPTPPPALPPRLAAPRR